MKKFEFISKYNPAGDQIKAIDDLTNNILNNGTRSQVLLGATGTGKTFTIANVIKNLNKKTLVLAHNKTLAAQLYSELKDFFPHNKVEFFVSYFDYYQPEAYLPTKDLYIEKSSLTNHEIEKMRVSTLNSLAHHNDVIVVASVAAIYASVSKKDFIDASYLIKTKQVIDPFELKSILVKLNYKFNPVNIVSGNFRQKGDVFDIGLGFTEDYFIRISFFGNEIEQITKIDSTTFKTIENIQSFMLTSANEYIVNNDNIGYAIQKIKSELQERIKYFNDKNKLVEAARIEQRTNYDIEAITEFGYCGGIENYARHLENREPGSTPYTIFDFLNDNNDWLLVVDESHITLPQIRGMHNTDKSRKQSLVEYGFRLPSALDNRPLNYDEFLSKLKYSIFVSATPNQWEIDYSNNIIVEQIVRPTGLLDPIIEIKPILNQIDSILVEIQNQIKKNERTFINVMTIRMAEELSKFLQENKIKAMYLHNELKTIERTKVLNDLRKGIYDVVIGINLLREGLDVPEVSLVLILDADKNGFFRSDKSLIQIIGRAARNANGRVIMYADEITESMEYAINETNRRRQIQLQYNKLNNIVPKTISKPIREDFNNSIYGDLLNKKIKSKNDFEETIKKLKKEMLDFSKKQEYEKAAEIRDLILELQAQKEIKQ